MAWATGSLVGRSVMGQIKCYRRHPDAALSGVMALSPEERATSASTGVAALTQAHQPPCGPPPRSKDRRDLLRWLAVVIDNDDRALGFVASMRYRLIKFGGLTVRQDEYEKRPFDLHERRFKLFHLQGQSRDG